MTTRIIDDDRIWEKMRRTFNTGGARVLVGIQGKDAQIDREGLTNVALGMIHEFGTIDGNIPERSFIRATIDTHIDKYFKVTAKLSAKVVVGDMTEKKALDILGQLVVSDIQSFIEAGIAPALKPETIARKGSSVPLIDTGVLKNSITSEVES